jgi:ATP phosphoribosyltransferase
MREKHFHFYASSFAYWRTNENIQELIKTMDELSEEGEYPYVMFYVPLPSDAEYKIDNYVPQVKEKIYLGSSDEARISYTNPTM